MIVNFCAHALNSNSLVVTDNWAPAVRAENIETSDLGQIIPNTMVAMVLHGRM